MKIIREPFELADSAKTVFRIRIEGELTGTDSESFREEMEALYDQDYDRVYVDLSSTSKTDLSAINELINAHHHLDKRAIKLILVYRKESDVEKWIGTTGLDRFMETAMVPSDQPK